jgi:hypothetical protein
VRRGLLGLTALSLLIVGVILWNRGGEEQVPAAGVMIRAGVLLAVVWLALPQLLQLFQRFPPWLLAGVSISLLVLIARPKLYVAVLPLLLLLGALQFFGWLMKPPPGAKRRR